MKSKDVIKKPNKAKKLLDLNPLFSKKDVIALLGVRKDKFQYWVRSRLIVPTVSNPGRGKSHQFNEKAIFYIALVQQFDALGFNLDSIRAILTNNQTEIDKLVNEFMPSLSPRTQKVGQKDSKAKRVLAIIRINGEPVLSWHETLEEAVQEFRPSKLRGKVIDTAPSITLIALLNILVQLEFKMIKHEANLLFIEALKKKSLDQALMDDVSLKWLAAEAENCGSKKWINAVKALTEMQEPGGEKPGSENDMK